MRKVRMLTTPSPPLVIQVLFGTKTPNPSMFLSWVEKKDKFNLIRSMFCEPDSQSTPFNSLDGSKNLPLVTLKK